MIWWIKGLIVGVLCFGVFVGYNIGKLEWSHNECNDVAGTTAWLSVRNGIYRCFWIEDKYPWRVKLQGVIDVR